ncbi:MAG: DNA repair protein RadC [Tissierellia bacterium]|nr:DNA repair protein RadC [Tissierellia bacterium]
MTKNKIESTSYKIMDMPDEDKPREKLAKLGVDYLSNAELLALIIKTGIKSENAIQLSQRILNMGNLDIDTERKKAVGLEFLRTVELDDLVQIKGIGQAKASQIIAVVELAKRLASASTFNRIVLNKTGILPKILMEEMRALKQEEFRVAILNTKKEMLHLQRISIGSLNMTIAFPREVFRTAIKKNAHSIILIHNHPSGDPKPSVEDINLTKRLRESGNILGIEVIDHIIIGDGEYCSFKEEGLI